MKTNNFPNPISKKILNIKADYSHITSRLFSSLSKSRQKPIPIKQQPLIKTIKKSVEKIEQLGEQKYKVAMRHVERFKKYDEEAKKRKLLQNEQIDQECTFKPKLTNNKKYNTQARFMNLSFTLRYLNKSKQSLLQSKNLSKQKPHTSRQNQPITNKLQPKPKRKILGQKLAQRLINWGRNRDNKIISKQVEAEVSKGVSRVESIESQNDRKSTISKEKSYRKLHLQKFNQTTASVLNNNKSKRKPLSNSQVLGENRNLTPNKSRVKIQDMVCSTISLKSADHINSQKRKQLLDGLLSELDIEKIDQNQVSEEKQQFIKKRLKFYTEISPSMSTYQTVGEQILSNQSQRGEESFYLRQAKANITKNYQKTQLLVKNSNYSKNFTKQSNKTMVVGSKNYHKV